MSYGGVERLICSSGCNAEDASTLAVLLLCVNYTLEDNSFGLITVGWVVVISVIFVRVEGIVEG